MVNVNKSISSVCSLQASGGPDDPAGPLLDLCPRGAWGISLEPKKSQPNKKKPDFQAIPFPKKKEYVFQKKKPYNLTRERRESGKALSWWDKTEVGRPKLQKQVPMNTASHWAIMKTRAAQANPYPPQDTVPCNYLHDLPDPPTPDKKMESMQSKKIRYIQAAAYRRASRGHTYWPLDGRNEMSANNDEGYEVYMGNFMRKLGRVHR